MKRFFIVCLICLLQTVHGSELKTATASIKQMPLERWFDGSVEAVNQATVSAQTSGRVAQIFFDIGDTVPSGAVILSLVSNEQREALNAAQAKLNEAQTTLDNQTKDFTRIDELYKQRIVSKSDWDKANTSLNVASAHLSAAQAAFKTAKEQLSYTEIKAPYGGIVSARHVELGEAVQPGSPLMSGFDPKALRVLVALPQSVAHKVRALNEAQIRFNGQTIKPTKIILYPIADPTTSTVKVRLELPELKDSLYPGEFVQAGFTIGDIQRLLIPIKSIVYRSEVTGVYVIENKAINLRQIRLGNQFGEDVEVLAGLKAGETIALDPVLAGIEAVKPLGETHE